MAVPPEETAALGEADILAEALPVAEPAAPGKTDVLAEGVAVGEPAALGETAEPYVLQEAEPYVLQEQEEYVLQEEEEGEEEYVVREEARPEPAGDYSLREGPRRELPEQRYLVADRSEDREPEVVAPPDRGWFLFGIFTFPWWPEARSRWAVLCMFFVPALCVVALVGFMNATGLGWAIPYLMVPLIWVLLWVLSYAAGCFVAIIGDTGSGNDEVSNWPDGDWRDRIGALLHVGLHFGLAMAAGFALTWPVGIFVASELGAVTTGLVANFFFPFFLLSSMEADTLLMPYSPVMLRSLLKTPVGWFIVYVETLVILAAVVVLVGLGFVFVPLATVLLASPLLATAVFILARLYGRLAWHIGQTQGPGKKRKRKKKVGTQARPSARRTEVSSKT